METRIEQDQTSLTGLAPTPDTKKKAAEAVKLSSPHLYELTARALVDRTDVLKKLAKDARGEGYVREAQSYEADAAAIDVVLLPQFRMQREFPLVDGEKFEKACGEAILGLARQAFAGLDEKGAKLTTDALERRRDRLVRDMSARIAAYARAVADSAYTHGYQVRTTTRDVIAAGELRALGGSGKAD